MLIKIYIKDFNKLTMVRQYYFEALRAPSLVMENVVITLPISMVAFLLSPENLELISNYLLELFIFKKIVARKIVAININFTFK